MVNRKGMDTAILLMLLLGIAALVLLTYFVINGVGGTGGKFSDTLLSLFGK